MSFARHETFYIRDGWLRKGLRLVDEKESGFGFFRKPEAPEVLGMGKNMVNSLKFWLVATGLVIEEKKQYKMSPFGKLVSTYDPYFEDYGTLWLLHYHLASKREGATTWYWFFNEFDHREFDETIFLSALEIWTKANTYEISAGSLKKDFQCLINTYIEEKQYDRNKTPEDNISCPLRELNLIRYTGKQTFRLNRPDKRNLHYLIVLYIIRQWQLASNRPEFITISDVLDRRMNAGRILNLSYEDTIHYLEQLQQQGLISLRRKYGLDAVDLTYQDEPEIILEQYYMSLRSEIDAIV